MNELIAAAVAAPGAAVALLAIAWLLGIECRERWIARLTGLVYSFSAAALLTPAVRMCFGDAAGWSIPLGEWFRVGDHAFQFALRADPVSLPMLLLTALLAGIIGAFSRTYMHREPGYFRFFFCLHLFAFGAMIAFAAGNLDLLIVGWELVGLSSVLLVGFFYERSGPPASAIRVFATYRSADVGLLVGVFAAHHFRHTSSLEGIAGHALKPDEATIVGLLLLVAAMGKAAQIPFSGWLPRAMEGPTPSSAIFYGAISVHLGAYLLLRAYPLLTASPAALLAVTLIGLGTAVHGVVVGRAASDAKTSLAYASITQLGLIFAEIGMGWTTIALIHILGHSVVRTLQFLRAPSMLHEYHHMHAAAGGRVDAAEASLESILPEGLRRRLYWFALDRAHLDRFLDAVIVRPVFAVSAWLAGSSQNPKASARSEAVPVALQEGADA
ncbi:MAG: hypothetical protein IPM24_00420 [Bryobacterales bacterium]|nr:hypothetical protein [Bryobacterales bacterium]